MSSPVEFRRNTADGATLADHLRGCAFEPPLQTLFDVDAYGAKLAGLAERFEAWADGELAGVVAVYCNDPSRAIAWVSNVSVLRGHTGAGIAAALLGRAVAHCDALGFTSVELEVNVGNPAAELYERFGFVESYREAGKARMRLALNG